MEKSPQNTQMSKRPVGISRRALSSGQTPLVNETPLFPDKSLPLLMQPAFAEVDLYSWGTQNSSLIEQKLLQHGAILFRGFRTTTSADFEKFVKVFGDDLLPYNERSSPRSLVSNNIYTSTEHPADQAIFLHNENSYQQSWPRKIFFFCETAPGAQGETPIANVQRVFERIDPAIRKRFLQLGWMYVRNFQAGIGLPWQTVFQTTDKQQVEAYCQANGISVEWKEGDGLRTRAVRPAIVRHPLTGALLWFNHAIFFHVSTLEPSAAAALLNTFREEDLPSNTYYGDGSAIEPEVLEHVKAAYHAETVMFPWQKGDILLVENMLVAHGRSPYKPPRKILVGMSGAVQSKDVIVDDKRE